MTSSSSGQRHAISATAAALSAETTLWGKGTSSLTPITFLHPLLYTHGMLEEVITRSLPQGNPETWNKKNTGKNSNIITIQFLTQFLTQIGTQLQNCQVLLYILTTKPPVKTFSAARSQDSCKRKKAKIYFKFYPRRHFLPKSNLQTHQKKENSK